MNANLYIFSKKQMMEWSDERKKFFGGKGNAYEKVRE